MEWTSIFKISTVPYMTNLNKLWTMSLITVRGLKTHLNLFFVRGSCVDTALNNVLEATKEISKQTPGCLIFSAYPSFDVKQPTLRCGRNTC